MDRSAELYDALIDAGLPDVAQYVVSMAYRVRFVMDMNAREAMHVIELRTAPQGHPAYRRVCQQMHRLIAERAGHRAIAAAMSFADHSEVELERLQEERRLEQKRSRPSGGEADVATRGVSQGVDPSWSSSLTSAISPPWTRGSFHRRERT